MKYRKKPLTIDAFEWTGDEACEWPDWAVEAATDGLIERIGDRLHIETLEGQMKAGLGSYIIRGAAGEIYPCKARIFELTYEVAE